MRAFDVSTYINSGLLSKGPHWMKVVVEYDDANHHSKAEDDRLLVSEPRVVLAVGKGGRKGCKPRDFHTNLHIFSHLLTFSRHFLSCLHLSLSLSLTPCLSSSPFLSVRLSVSPCLSLSLSLFLSVSVPVSLCLCLCLSLSLTLLTHAFSQMTRHTEAIVQRHSVAFSKVTGEVF